MHLIALRKQRLHALLSKGLRDIVYTAFGGVIQFHKHVVVGGFGKGCAGEE